MPGQVVKNPAQQNIAALVQEIGAQNPLQQQFVRNSAAGLDGEERDWFGAYLDYCLATGQSLASLAACYNLLVKDTMREQMYFQRHGRYRCSTYSEVSDAVYQNPEYMEQYMAGLALTAFLWPNHRKMRKSFLRKLPRERGGHYLEVGPGHGFHMMSAMRLSAYETFTGVDISPKSVEMTRSIIESGFFGRWENYELVCQDFLECEAPPGKYGALVAGEVLEHVEQPLAFLRKLHELAAPDAFIYVTTAVNAAEIDHIYLFDSVGPVRRMTEEAGLRIEDEEGFPYTGLSLEECEGRRLPVNLALVLGT